VNCQRYSGWRLGKRKPGVVPDGVGLVKAAGESIKVRGVGLCGGVGLVPVRETAPPLLTLRMKPFGRRQLDSERVVAAMSGKVEAMPCARACGSG